MSVRNSPSARQASYEQLLEQERLIIAATELILELMEAEGVTKSELATRISRTKGYVSQLLSGSRNLTLRTFADLTYALNHRIHLEATPVALPINQRAEADERPRGPKIVATRLAGPYRGIHTTLGERQVVKPGRRPYTSCLDDIGVTVEAA